jgi:hypothetical protein
MEHDIFEREYEHDGGVMVHLDAKGSSHPYEWYRDEAGHICFNHDAIPLDLRAALIEKIERHDSKR